MKFYCESCNTKYAIADDKVRGKVLKVRCKKCENIITVREAKAPDAPQVSTETADGLPDSNWYFAVNGVTTGPLGIESIRSKFASGEVGDEAYVWHDTFDKWEPVSSVEAFAEALAEGQALKPRAKTLGFTGKLQAVKAPEGANKSTSGTVPKPTEKAAEPAPKREEPKAEAEAPAKPAAESGAVRKDKLAALRAKLDEKKAADGAEKEKPAQLPERPAIAAPPKPKPAEEAKESSAPAPKPAESSKPVALAAPPSPSKPVLAATPDDDDDIPDVPPGVTASTTSTSDIFDVPASLDEDDEPSSDDAVPFFPSTPTPAEPAEQSALTGSLLIQLDQIQKKSRGSRYFGVVVMVLFLSAAVAGGIYISQKEPLEEGNFTASAGPGSGEHRELNFRTYSDDQQKKIMKVMELGDEELSMEFDEAEVAEGEEPKAKAAVAKQPGDSAEPKEPSKVVAKKPEVEEAEKPAEVEKDEGKTLAMARIKGPETEGDKPTAEETRRKAERFRSATSTVKARTTEIARPQDKLNGAVDPKATLTREQALDGMKKVSRSVQLCRERHMRRGGAFDSPKIFVTVTVNGDGRVGEFDAEPKSLQTTEFGRCMNSHKGRWRFHAFGGKPQQVRRRFIIQ